MKVLLAAAILSATALPAFAADVTVSATVGDPHFYGRIDVVGYPQPQLVYAEPVVIQPAAGVIVQPVYVRVPPGHAKDWRKHCKKYKLCATPVYFVQDGWYTQVYVPEYRAHKGKDKEKNKHDKEKGKGKDK